MRKHRTPISLQDLLSLILHVKMTLRDVIYISYALPVENLKPLVPNALRLATVDSNIAFVSLVVLRSTKVRLSSFPVLTFNYNQFNIRTYVIDPVSSRFAVYFLRSGVTSKVISFATSTIGISWKFIKLTMNFIASKRVQSLSIKGDWEGLFSLQVRADAGASVVPLFFPDRKSAVDFLIRPLIGFSGYSRRLVRFTIQHPEVQPESWSLVELDCPIFNKLVKIDDVMKPHSVFYLRIADFSIFSPPQKIREAR